MFTGIVQGIGKITRKEKKGDGLRFEIQEKTRRVKLGSSVCLSGVCLTVAKKTKDTLTFDVMGETVKKTTLGEKKICDAVNLEASLRLGDEVGGHLVFGHIDATGEIKEIKKLRNSRLVIIQVPAKLMKYIVPQGSVAIDGVSLTVARAGKNDFTVALVGYTIEHTTLKNLQRGDRVNVECDMLAKYVERGIKTSKH